VFNLPVSQGKLEEIAGDEGRQIAEMVIPLTPLEAQERYERFGGDDPAKFPAAEDAHYFTCRHWDEGTRLCLNYENRPPMCSNYPYGRECDHGCSCKGTPVITKDEADA
jgi:Fe-S-cluster containining protein